jgi:hypothetical protein
MNSFSIYIPRLKSNVTEDYIKYVFRSTSVGEVARVDFTPINKKPGFGENVDNVVKSAFVHFSFFTNISNADPVFGNKVREGNGYKFYLGTVQEGYWLLLPAKNHIQQTMMNNSQIVDNSRYLEAKLEEQEAVLTKQTLTIQELQKKLDGVQNVVCQLLVGLFNQSNQREIFETHLSILFSEDRVRSKFEDPVNSEWDIYPTTHQGDANEEKIKCLQKKFNDLIVTVNNHSVKGSAMELNTGIRLFDLEEQMEARKIVPTPYPMQQINNELITESTYSSIVESDSDCDSMPNLESILFANSKERLRNSYELCGNE